MKILILTWIAAALLLAQNKDTNQSKETKPSQDTGKTDASKSVSSADSVIPKGATQVEPNLYRYTDAQGKTWFYRRFPFGVSKRTTPT